MSFPVLQKVLSERNTTHVGEKGSTGTPTAQKKSLVFKKAERMFA